MNKNEPEWKLTEAEISAEIKEVCKKMRADVDRLEWLHKKLEESKK